LRGFLQSNVFPILFELPNQNVLVSTTKLSQFVTARYAPVDVMAAVWKGVLGYLQPGVPAPELKWQQAVHPTYGPQDKLPADAAKQAFLRGIDWHYEARMLVDKSWEDKLVKGRGLGAAPDHNWAVGDGSCGLLEGVCSPIDYLGNQRVSYGRRSDCNGESSLAFALRSRLDGDARSAKVARNLLDWIYANLVFDDPAKSDYGILKWTSQNSPNLYQDNDVKVMLGTMGTAAILGTDQWDKKLLELHFCTNEGIGFTKRTAQRVVKRVANQALITKPVTPHTLRHYAESRIMPSSAAGARYSLVNPSEPGAGARHN